MATDIAGGTGSAADTRWRSERTVWSAQMPMCVCVMHQDFPVDVQAMTVTINKMGMTVIFAFMEGKSSNNVKSPFYRTVMAL